LADLEAVFARHGLSIGHEDSQGAFIIEPFDEYNVRWLRSAHVGDIGPDPGIAALVDGHGDLARAAMTAERRALLTGIAAAALWVPVSDVVVDDDGRVSLGCALTSSENDALAIVMRHAMGENDGSASR